MALEEKYTLQKNMNGDKIRYMIITHSQTAARPLFLRQCLHFPQKSVPHTLYVLCGQMGGSEVGCPKAPALVLLHDFFDSVIYHLYDFDLFQL